MPQLPAIQIEPRNALLDFSPISNAIDSNRRNALMQREDARQNEELTLRKDQMQYQRGRDQKLDARQELEWYGKAAMAVDQMQDGPQRQAAWQRVVARHGADGLTPEELDHKSGPKLMAAQAGQFLDPLEQQTKQLRVQALQSDLSNAPLERRYKEAQIKALEDKSSDPIEQLLIERLRGGGRPAVPQPPSQQPMLQPQSFNGAVPMPGVQLISDEAQPLVPAAPTAEAPRQYTTPYGKMTREEAESLAGPMLLNPKYSAAGKAILDSIQGGGEGALGKAGENAVDEKAIGMIDLAGRLDSIAQGFKPEYQTYETAAKMYGLSWQDSFEATRKNMKPEDRQKLADYTSFKQNATNNLSEYIKYITGAAMGIQEEGRIRKGMPDPEKDSPAQFEAKMRNAVGQSKLALARYNYLKRNGYDDRTIQTLAKSDRIGAMVPLSDMQGIINQRLDQAAQEMKSRNPSLDPQSLKQQLRVIQRREFGI
jgi:hypothetical protein